MGVLAFGGGLYMEEALAMRIWTERYRRTSRAGERFPSGWVLAARGAAAPLAGEAAGGVGSLARLSLYPYIGTMNINEHHAHDDARTSALAENSSLTERAATSSLSDGVGSAAANAARVATTPSWVEESFMVIGADKHGNILR